MWISEWCLFFILKKKGVGEGGIILDDIVCLKMMKIQCWLICPVLQLYVFQFVSFASIAHFPSRSSFQLIKIMCRGTQ